jgi:Cu(I)/Ag(I) efflux system membrane fusion protein
MPWISIGQNVTVTTPAIPGKTFEGKITFIDPNFDEVTRSTKVRVELPNPKVNGRRELLHKLYADGKVHVDTTEVLAVPKSAIIQTGPAPVVYVDRDGGAYEQMQVKTGRRGDKWVEILSGIKSGDKVVTNGNLLIDGQAEMNRAFMQPAETTPVAAADLTAEQKETFARFIHLADSMSAALAADDLEAFDKASQPAMKVTAEFTHAIAGLPVARKNITALEQARHFHGNQDLKGARASFHPFSMAAADVLASLRSLDGFPEVHIWECPMVDEALPDVPKKGRWIQAGNRPGANPYFGADMLECGKEIKP